MNTTLYLDGKTAYISRFGVASLRVKKGDFESLIKPADKIIDVIVNRDTAAKYAKRMNLLGYTLSKKIEYDMFTFKLTYQAL